jgi:hypothetical protein
MATNIKIFPLGKKVVSPIFPDVLPPPNVKNKKYLTEKLLRDNIDDKNVVLMREER